MIEVEQLNKRFGPRHAVREVSFCVDRGDVLGFLGPNGAGKTTTMRMITGFLPPSSGRIHVLGKSVESNALHARRAIGYLPENAPSYGEMRVRDFLHFIAEMRGFFGATRNKRTEEVMERCFLSHVQLQTIETLSKGYRQRVGLAQALIHEPDILILDEPTDGLDPNQKHIVRNMITEMGKDKAIILSTHVLEEVEAICSRVIIIAGGTVIADDTTAGLKERSRFHNAVVMELESAPKQIVEKLASIDAVERVEHISKSSYRLYPKAKQSIFKIVLENAHTHKWPVRTIRAEEGRLDEVFRQLTATQAEEAQVA